MEFTENILLFLYMISTAAAGYALGYLLVNEEGPFDILVKFRRLIGISQEVEDKMLEGDYSARDGLNVFAKMVTCDLCASVAITIVLSVILAFSGVFPEGYPTILKILLPFSTIGILFLFKKV